MKKQFFKATLFVANINTKQTNASILDLPYLCKSQFAWPFLLTFLYLCCNSLVSVASSAISATKTSWLKCLGTYIVKLLRHRHKSYHTRVLHNNRALYFLYSESLSGMFHCFEPCLG